MEKLQTYHIDSDPFTTFSNWLTQALEVEENANAFSLATASKQGRPSCRYLLFKGLMEKRFLFFSNYLSNKAQDLAENPVGEMSFYWHKTKRQVRIYGEIIKTPRNVSKEYFSRRAKESQAASAASHQSAKIEDRSILINKYQTILDESVNGVECPEFWGGYLLTPKQIEFFIYGENRLNDRFLFELDTNGEWEINRLSP